LVVESTQAHAARSQHPHKTIAGRELTRALNSGLVQQDGKDLTTTKAGAQAGEVTRWTHADHVLKALASTLKPVLRDGREENDDLYNRPHFARRIVFQDDLHHALALGAVVIEGNHLTISEIGRARQTANN
jgi:hypothetical protein